MTLEKIDIKTYSEEWNSFIKSNLTFEVDNYFIAHNPCLAEIYENVFNYKSEYYLIVEKDKVVGLLPGFRIKEKFISVPIFPSAGIFINKPNNKLNIYNKLINQLGDYEIRDIIKFSKYIYDKKIICYLPLKESEDLQWNILKASVRNQIRKAHKNGLYVKYGGKELLDDFYKIYSFNMHRLGSPVIDKKFFISLIDNYKNGMTKIFLSYYGDTPVGGSFVLSYFNLLEVGWASIIKDYNKLKPNMVLYWEMIKFAIENEMKYFSFGRATKGSGSHKFKLQWGVIELPIFFNYAKYTFDIRRLKILNFIWSKLPLGLANKLGPSIRKWIKI
jgi:serine/alanine adding enzyme